MDWECLLIRLVRPRWLMCRAFGNRVFQTVKKHYRPPLPLDSTTDPERVLSQQKMWCEMDEKALLALWNDKRTQIISAQMAPSFVLIAILVVAGFGNFSDASDGVKFLAIGVAVATGILAVLSQYAAIREAKAMVQDINKLENPSALAKKIGQSDVFLSLTAVGIIGLSAVVFALVLWAVLA